MREYLVEWRIEIDAESEEDAARRALEIQRTPGSTATVFHVTNEEGDEPVVIDLDQ